MNNRQRRREIEKLEKKAKEFYNGGHVVMYSECLAKIGALKNGIVEDTRKSFGEIAKDTMTPEEEKDFTVSVITMLVYADLLSGAALDVQKHLRHYKAFTSSDVENCRSAINLLNKVVATVSRVSVKGPIRNEHGELTTFNDHYNTIVEEVEQKMFGLKNIINQVIRSKTIRENGSMV